MAKDANVIGTDMKGLTVRWSRFIEGVDMVYAGIRSMLEALDAETMGEALMRKGQVMERTTQSVVDKKEEKDAGEKTGSGGCTHKFLVII